MDWHLIGVCALRYLIEWLPILLLMAVLFWFLARVVKAQRQQIADAQKIQREQIAVLERIAKALESRKSA
jgi:4-hydroxybenzoate polyprenyltransferase